MKILLLNLTRFGDLLQSQPAITALAHNAHEVGLVCLENFAGATELLNDVTYVTALPGAYVLRSIATQSTSAKMEENAQWLAGLGHLCQWKAQVNDTFAYDMVCNMTPTLSARLLGRFLAGNKPLQGFGLDASGFGFCSTAWGTFLQGASAVRGVSPFNIVDLFREMVVQSAKQNNG